MNQDTKNKQVEYALNLLKWIDESKISGMDLISETKADHIKNTLTFKDKEYPAFKYSLTVTVKWNDDD